MRILFVSAYGLPHMGGIEVAVDALATELAKRGHRVVHVTSSCERENDNLGREYEVVRVPAMNPLEAHLGVPYPIFDPRLLSVLRREVEQADIVHAHGYLYPGTVVAAALARRGSSPTPLVVTEHVGHVPYDSKPLDAIEAAAIRVLGRRVLRRADVVVTYNDRVADQLLALCPSLRLETILNGVDHRLFRPPEDGERIKLRAELDWDDRPRALFVGRPVAKKGFPAALAAVRETTPQMTLAVAGPERLPLGTPPGVESLGKLSRQRLAEIFRACDVLLIPSRGEGFPLAAQEALASGLPLLLAEDPGYAPNLDGAGAGVRVVGDPAGFAAALTALIGDPPALEEARMAAAQHARTAFSWPDAASRHEGLYRGLSAQDVGVR